MVQVKFDELLQVGCGREGSSPLPVPDCSLRHAQLDCHIGLSQTCLLAQGQCHQTKTVIFELVAMMIAHGSVLPTAVLPYDTAIDRNQPERAQRPRVVKIFPLSC